MLQRIRNLKRCKNVNEKNQTQQSTTQIDQFANMDTSNGFKICFIDPPKQDGIGKMDGSTLHSSPSGMPLSGIYYMFPVIEKMDSLNENSSINSTAYS